MPRARIARGFSMHNDSRHNATSTSRSNDYHWMKRWGVRLLVAGICLVAIVVRLHGIAWDGGHLFHPDERFIIQVASGITLPDNWASALAPASSLSPFRGVDGTQRFPYGHITVYLVRATEPLFAPVARHFLDDTLIATGRLLAIIADSATVALTYLLGRRLYGTAAGLLASSAVALAVMHIQQAHFYTADILLVPVTLVTLYALVALVESPATDDIASHSLVAGTAFGVAMGIKASALLMLVPLVVAHVVPAMERNISWREQVGRIGESPAWGWFGPAVLCAGGVFVLTNPYAFIDWQQFVRSLSVEAGMVRGQWITPYTEQYWGTIPYLYPFLQQARWFLGPTLAALAWGGTALTIWRAVRRRVTLAELVLLAWVVPSVLVVGGLFVQFPRYWLPAIPVMVVLGSGRLMDSMPSPRRQLIAAGVVLVPAALYVVAFSRIYSERHPWLQSSEWIYRNVPAGSALMVERWDHSLPVPLMVDGQARTSDEYQFIEVDSFAEPAELAAVLDDADVIVLSSPRIWKVVIAQAEHHPRAAALYRNLLSGETRFRMTGIWRVEPRAGPVSLRSNPFVEADLPTPAAWREAAPAPYSISFGPADESFSVYDHPLPIVLQK